MTSPRLRQAFNLASLLALTACTPAITKAPPAATDVDWPHYGGDAGGQRFSSAAQITPENVRGLKVAWTYSTGEMKRHPDAIKHAAFENTPILAGGRLFVCSQFNAVSAVDPVTGQQLWQYDPKVDPTVEYPNDFTCRGVTYWRDPVAPAKTPCAERVYLPTADRRLIALDAASGALCKAFGTAGVVDVGGGLKLEHAGQMQITSPPVIARGVIVVGSSLDDNQRVRELSGAVRAYDVRTGAPKWSFDPLAASAPGNVAGAANA